MIQRRVFGLGLALLLAAADSGAVLADAGREHGPGGWDVRAGAFHVHFVPVDQGFEIHVHDAATHGTVDLSRATCKATLLADGKTSVLPLAVKGAGILKSAQALPRQWTLLVSLNVPGQKPAQARFTSRQIAEHAR